MKIGITCYPTYGGSGVVATELGRVLASRGHEVHFISYAMPTRLSSLFKDNVFYHEVEMYSYPLFDFPLYSIALSSKMVEIVTYNDIELIHAHYAIPHATSAYLAKEILRKEGKGNDIKIITTLHGTDITLIGLEPDFLPTMKFSIEQSDGVTAVSNFLRDKTLSNYKIDKDIEVIPNFINTEKYRRLDNEKTKCFKENFAPNNEKILVHTSNFRPLKRVPDVIEIFAEVREKIPSNLMLIGDGPARSECERICRDYGICDSVKFMGKQDCITELLSIADLFILPSQSESFGLSALEAMSCSVPVISSSVGGLPELNIHGETGFIAEIGDINRMAKYAVDLLTNDKKYKLFQANARKRACEFSDEKIIPLYEGFYEKVLME